MSEQEFEVYLRLMGRFLHLSGQQRDTIGRELRGHMEERLEDLLSRGFTREEAIGTILDEFGDAAALANDFGQIGRRKKWVVRSAAGTVAVAAAVLIVCLLLPANRLPSLSLSQAGPNATVSSDSTVTTEARTVIAESKAVIPVWPRQGGEVEREIQRKLQAPISVDFAEGTAFHDVLEYLRDKSSLSIDVSWNALAASGIDKTTDCLGMRLTNIKIESVLATLLENVGGPEGKLDYACTNGFIRISTREDLDHHPVVRIYDIRELIGRPTQGDLAAIIADHRRHPATRPASWGMGGMGESTLPATRPSDDMVEMAGAAREHEERRVDDLKDVIKSTVGPGTWDPDGSLGSISYYDGLLVASTSARMHQQLFDLLTTMQQALTAREHATGNAENKSARHAAPSDIELQAERLVVEMNGSRLGTGKGGVRMYSTTRPAHAASRR